MRWLREEAGVDTVVILGNSGGGSLMGAYLSQATEPVDRAGRRARRCPDAVLDLPAADLYVSLNAHPGRPEVLTAWIDPSVTDETDPLSVDPDLDMFDPRHGPPYDADVRRALPRRAARAEPPHHRLGAAPSSTAWPRPARGTAPSTCTGSGPTCASPTSPSTRPTASPAATPATRGAPTTGRSPSAAPARSARGCRCGASRHRSARAPRTWPASRCRRWWCSRSPTEACSRATPHAIHDALAAEDKALELVPGEHYFETGGRDEVADLVTAWIEART